MTFIPVITIDGPSGSGKGTIASLLASHLQYHLLDSGAIYRLTGLAAARNGLLDQPEQKICELIPQLEIKFTPVLSGNGISSIQIFLNAEDVTEAIRTEQVGNYASLVGAMPLVRKALLQLQHDFAKTPGLIADGRDMGTVVFPDAPLKFYLTASAEARAERRMKQLHNLGFDANLAGILSTIKERDARDMDRAVAPLKPAKDALIIDASDKTVDEVMKIVLGQVDQVLM